MEIPKEYAGREQTFLKHRVLEEYLLGWAHKLGSPKSGQVRLWYVDCFAGPWEAMSPELADTSIAIGLSSLQTAAATWREKGWNIALSALFVEKSARSFKLLSKYIEDHVGAVDATTFHGEFGQYVEEIDRRIGSDPAFLFVDPTGWKGAAMDFIAPLASRPRRDVLVNVMFNDINRQKANPADEIRAQIADFFGLDDDGILRGLDEEQLLTLYREKLKEKCGVRYAADLAIPHPHIDRTWFRLVVGGHHPAVLELFRTVEHHVVGRTAATVRAAARAVARSNPQQHGLFDTQAAAPSSDRRFEIRVQAHQHQARQEVVRLVRASPRGIRFRELLHPLMERFSLRRSDVEQIMKTLRKQRALELPGIVGQKARLDDNQIVFPPT